MNVTARVATAQLVQAMAVPVVALLTDDSENCRAPSTANPAGNFSVFFLVNKILTNL